MTRDASAEPARVALVTGASRGIGAAVATTLAEAGMDVAVHCHSKADQAAGVADAIRALDRRSLLISQDLSTRVGVLETYEQALAAFGRLDVVVNNAGALPDLPSRCDLAEAEEIWEKTMAINAKGIFLSCLRAAEIFSAQSADLTPRPAVTGRIINVGSVGGILAVPGSPHYGASKAAVHSLTLSFAERLGRKGVLVNAVAPGFVKTDMTAKYESIADIVSQQTPLGRWASPRDVAEVVGFLATSGNFVTGQVIPVDGGIGNLYAWIPRKG